MKRKIGILLLVVLVIMTLNFLFTKRISHWIVSAKFETQHLTFFSSKRDFELAKNISNVVEKDYNRLKNNYITDTENKINIKIFTSLQFYNMAYGNPLPFPRKAGNYAGQSIENTVYVLTPNTWKELSDTIFPPDRTRTLLTHEMAHSFVYLLNPNVSGWLSEGIALYEQTPVFNESIRKAGFISWIGNDIKSGLIPDFSELFNGKKITDPSITKDYVFAGSFVDFVVMKYDYNVLTKFVKSQDFKESFEKSESEIQDEWKRFLSDFYISN